MDALSTIEDALEQKSKQIESAGERAADLRVETLEAEATLDELRDGWSKLDAARRALLGEQHATPAPVAEAAVVAPTEKAKDAPVDPLDAFSCTGCGEAGSLRRGHKAIKGRYVSTIICNDCGNETLTG